MFWVGPNCILPKDQSVEYNTDVAASDSHLSANLPCTLETTILIAHSAMRRLLICCSLGDNQLWADHQILDFEARQGQQVYIRNVFK
jgi:hypothetical protein